MIDIDWHAGSDGIRQTVYRSKDGHSLSIRLTKLDIVMELTDENGEVVGSECATYEDIMDGLK